MVRRSKDYTYGRFKDNVLKKAVEEINLKIDDMDLEIFQGRYNRKVVKLKFIITGPYIQNSIINDKRN